MVDSSRVKRNSLYLVSAFIAQKAITLFYFILIARTFGPQDQGLYSTALAFSALFAVFIDFGIASVMTREVARSPEHAGRYLSQSLIFRIGAGILTIAGIILIAHGAGYSPTLIAMISIAAFATFVDMLSVSIWAIFRGLHTIKYEAIGVVATTAVMVGIGVAYIALGFPVAFLLFASLIASVFNFLFGLFLLLKKTAVRITWKMDRPLLWSLILMALPFAWTTIFSRIYTNIDVSILARISGAEYAGWYMAANKIVLALQFIPASLSASVYPAMSAYFKTAHDRLARTFVRAQYYLMLGVFPLAIVLGVLAEKLIIAAYGVSYEPAVQVLQLLTGALVCAFLIYPFGSLLAATDRQRISAWIWGCAALGNAALNLLLIPRYGINAAALISTGTYAFILITCFITTWQFWKEESRWLAFMTLRILCASGILAVTLFFVRDASLWLSLPLSVCVYTAALFLVRALRGEDISEIATLFSRKNGV